MNFKIIKKIEQSPLEALRTKWEISQEKSNQIISMILENLKKEEFSIEEFKSTQTLFLNVLMEMLNIVNSLMYGLFEVLIALDVCDLSECNLESNFCN